VSLTLVFLDGLSPPLVGFGPFGGGGWSFVDQDDQPPPCEALSPRSISVPPCGFIMRWSGAVVPLHSSQRPDVFTQRLIGIENPRKNWFVLSNPVRVRKCIERSPFTGPMPRLPQSRLLSCLVKRVGSSSSAPPLSSPL